MKSLKVLCALAAVLVATPMSAFAQQYANMARQANLRAGPSTDYPIVAVLPAGISVWVDGCIDGYRWCDVTVGPDRGWLYAGNIIYPYQGGRVPLLNYGAVIGIGIIAFSLGDYWDHYYQNRPWYPQRQHWIDRPRRVIRPGVGRVRPLPPGSPPRADGVQHLPAERPTGDVLQPSSRTFPANGQVPPRIPPQGGQSDLEAGCASGRRSATTSRSGACEEATSTRESASKREGAFAPRATGWGQASALGRATRWRQEVNSSWELGSRADPAALCLRAQLFQLVQRFKCLARTEFIRI
jgi:uncharacterized protein YraI